MLFGLAIAVLIEMADQAETEAAALAVTEVEERGEGTPAALVGNREHQDSLKACAARMRGLLPGSARIDVSVAVDEAGTVTSVSATAPKDLSRVAACVETRVKHWRLPASAHGYSLSLPVILHGDSP